MKQYTLENVPPNMFTKAKLKKMGLTPYFEHIAYITFPPKKRRYKLYSIDNALPTDKNAGYSL